MASTASIEQLVADGVVDEVVQRVKTGKEAEVFVVRKGADYLAAKVYKERTQRNFKNNVGYMEGRSVRNSRDMRAMAKRTSYGVDQAEAAWMLTEHDALVTAAAAGIRVPKPELFYEGVLLMELVLDPEGQPAPRLSELAFTPDEALAHHRELVSMIVRLLCCDLIHGDLSPYNVLLAWNGPTIIDMPQVVKAAHNSQAEQFLLRDVRNVTDFFVRFAPELKKRLHDGPIIWRKYLRRELAPDYFPEEGASVPPVPREAAPAASRPPRPPGGPGARPSGEAPPSRRPNIDTTGAAPRPPQGPPSRRPNIDTTGAAPRPPQGPTSRRPSIDTAGAAPRPPQGSPSRRPNIDTTGAAPRPPQGSPSRRPNIDTTGAGRPASAVPAAPGAPRRGNIDTASLVAAASRSAPGPVASGRTAPPPRPPGPPSRGPSREIPVERVTRLAPPPKRPA